MIFIETGNATGSFHKSFDCKNDYAFYALGGWSSGIPYLAGLYALACQVKPNITPKIFWNAALKTGEKRIIQKGNKSYTGKIINPGKLIESLRDAKYLFSW
jgi:hypothetical protein